MTQLPEGFVIVAGSKKIPIAAIANEEKNLSGVQFHSETTLSEHGKELLHNFVLILLKHKQIGI